MGLKEFSDAPHIFGSTRYLSACGTILILEKFYSIESLRCVDPFV